MGKKRFNLDDNFDDVVNYIDTPKDIPAPAAPAAPAEVKETPKAVNEQKDVTGKEGAYNEPNKLFRRNITLSEEIFWRLNYIKDRKNKNRSDGDKFVTIDGLMFDMIQQCLDTQYASTKQKFEQYKNDDAEDWI